MRRVKEFVAFYYIIFFDTSIFVPVFIARFFFSLYILFSDGPAACAARVFHIHGVSNTNRTRLLLGHTNNTAETRRIHTLTVQSVSDDQFS